MSSFLPFDPFKEKGQRGLGAMPSSRHPSCQPMCAKGSERRALGKGDSLSLFPGILILRSDKKKKSSVTLTGSGDGWPCCRCGSSTAPAPKNGPAWGGGAASRGGCRALPLPRVCRYWGARAGLTGAGLRGDGAGGDVAQAGARSFFWLRAHGVIPEDPEFCRTSLLSLFPRYQVVP